MCLVSVDNPFASEGLWTHLADKSVASFGASGTPHRVIGGGTTHTLHLHAPHAHSTASHLFHCEMCPVRNSQSTSAPPHYARLRHDDWRITQPSGDLSDLTRQSSHTLRFICSLAVREYRRTDTLLRPMIGERTLRSIPFRSNSGSLLGSIELIRDPPFPLHYITLHAHSLFARLRLQVYCKAYAFIVYQCEKAV